MRFDPTLINATVVNGALSALTPISIIWGAILLSQTMRRAGAESIIGQWLNGVGPYPVAQLMIVGWAFAFMIEGSSGFGTPAAIAAPLLVELGFDPVGGLHVNHEFSTCYLRCGRHAKLVWVQSIGADPLRNALRGMEERFCA
jgi:L-lactate permease